MRQILSILIVVAIISVASLAYAQDPGTKLCRGFVNATTGLLELPITIFKTSKNEGYPTGLTLGVGEGLFNGVYRTLVGVYEVITFPIPAPAGYKAVLSPDTLWTSETLHKENPKMRSDFSLLSDELKKPKK